MNYIVWTFEPNISVEGSVEQRQNHPFDPYVKGEL